MLAMTDISWIFAREGMVGGIAANHPLPRFTIFKHIVIANEVKQSILM